MAIPTTGIVITPTDLMDHFNILDFVDNPFKERPSRIHAHLRS